MKYITKPIEIEAIQWLGNNEQEVFDFCGNKAYRIPHSCYMVILMPVGELRAVPGNYIVRDINNSNEYRIYRAQQFQDMYELVKE